jgi:small subunit ribosomal protein S4
MGDPRKLKKKYKSPKHPWEKKRIEQENKLVREYGLKNKKEVWIAKTEVSKFRYLARGLVGLGTEERKEKEDILLNKLRKLGLMKNGGSLDEILSLKVEDLLNRRLQTQVWKKGLAITPVQARQFITHGHIGVAGRKITAPGMIVTTDIEEKINWHGAPLITAPKVITAEVEVVPGTEVGKKEVEKAAKEESEIKEFKCAACGKAFKSERGLKIHAKTHGEAS